MFYEDMKANPKEEITKLQKFLGTNLTDEQIDDVVEYTSFSAMKERDCVMESGNSTADPEDSFTIKEVEEKDGGFFRKGNLSISRKVYFIQRLFFPHIFMYIYIIHTYFLE
ncbi:UNVERIFIED_CONTAM: hypothetical protein GTU68_042830 [Idotea baltica]|nr:hypothetical protein [Idotea baltica]